MRKTARLVAVSLLATMLAACASGTPGCDDRAVKERLSEIARAYLNKQATYQWAHESLAQAMENRVALDFRTIRVTDRDKDVDAYQCSAELMVEVDGGKGGRWQKAFHYVVYSVEDADADFGVDYEEPGLYDLRAAAEKLNAIIWAPIQQQQKIDDAQKELQEIRNAGGTGTDAEEMRIEFVRNAGGEPPAATDGQKRLAIEAMLKMYDPQRQYENVPEDVLRQVRERATRELAERPIYNMYGQPITVDELTGQAEVQPEQSGGESSNQ